MWSAFEMDVYFETGLLFVTLSFSPNLAKQIYILLRQKILAFASLELLRFTYPKDTTE